jgi:hypothetical protein
MPFIEFRNGAHCDLMCRIVKVTTTGNHFVYIEDVPKDLSYTNMKEMEKQGWIFVKSNWFEVLQKIEQSRF